MKIVVTGGAGFIGGNLCQRILERIPATELVVLDDLSTGRAENLEGIAAKLVIGSILDEELVSNVLNGADAVVHLAALTSVGRSLVEPLAVHAVNVKGTINILEAARASGSQVILASSSSVYGDSAQDRKHEELPANPISPYGASKLAAETYTLCYGRSFGIPALAFRFFNVFGPGQRADSQYAAVIPRFVERALRDEALVINGDGRQTRDFTYVGSVTAVLSDAIVRKVHSPRPVNLAFGMDVEVLKVANLIAGFTGRAAKFDFQPKRPGDILRSRADGSRLVELFPTARPVPLEVGLAATVRWFESQRAAS